ncbi:fasciclin-2-like isoform X2 [Paramacrobiotus metropolitanus]|uniref:fasciclin-2-like isoform X2 n=1 Tax=Paramacrobiotus metropolitanus TaxID=2943436 RepID=UPI002445AF1D|nr:fasciclin-2-like isoform X2 [Paramacrobiotus metropolitanus]
MLAHSRQLITCLGVFLALSYRTAAQNDPKLVLQPATGNLTTAIDSDPFIECTVQPQTAKGAVANVRWLDPEGNEIGDKGLNNRKYTKNAFGGTFGRSLKFFKGQKDDSGLYKCVADFYGHDRLETGVYVVFYEDIKFEDAPTLQHPLLNTAGKVRCLVSGNPAPIVEWWHNQAIVTSGGRYRVETDGLVIEDIGVEDNGEYTCTAAVPEMGRSIERQINVEVHSAPEFKADGLPKPARGLEGRSASMECEATGIPMPEIKWIFVPNGEDVTKLEHDEQKTRRHTVDPVTGTMNINDLKKVDQGQYKCMAENAAGRKEETAELFVAEKPRFDVVTNTTMHENKSATIECTVRGDPAPTLRYIREGTELPITADTDPRYVLVENERELRLTINDLQRSDDGLYTCEASNEAGVETKASHITVQFAPSFANTPMHVAKTWMGNLEAVNITCIAESIPNATIRWQQRIINSPHHLPTKDITEQMEQDGYKIENRGPSSSLLVSAVSYDIFGEYLCIASNELGESTHVVRLLQATVPKPIASVRVEELTATTVRFEIISPNDDENLILEGYDVFYIKVATEENFQQAPARSWPIGVPYTVEGLEPGRSYRFRFYPKNRVGVGAAFDKEVSMPEIGPPRPPTFLPNGNDTSGEATRYRLQWQEPNDNGAKIVEYKITYWKASEGREASRVVTTRAPASSYVLTGLEGGTTYQVEIVARNERGFSAPLELFFTTGHAQGFHKIDPVEGDVQLSTPVIIGIAVAAGLLLALIIDLTCFCTRHAGLTHWLATRLCGKSEKLKNHDVENIRHTETDQVDKASSYLIFSNLAYHDSNKQNGSNTANRTQSDDTNLYERIADSGFCEGDEQGRYQVGATRSLSMGSLVQLETDV